MSKLPPPTIILDIDGCIFKHHGTLDEIKEKPAKLLPGSKEKIDEWLSNKHKVILFTGRSYDMTKLTMEQLREHNIKYTCLIMDVGHGVRYLTNDDKPYADLYETAHGITIPRDGGLKQVDIPDE